MARYNEHLIKKIYSQRNVNKNGIIPLIYKENINYLLDKIEELEDRIEILEAGNNEYAGT